MMKKLMFLGAGAIGYVLGAKAGRERYEQIADSAQRLRQNPKVQQKVEEVKVKAQDAAGSAMDKVKEQAGGGSSGHIPTGTTTSAASSASAVPKSFGLGNEDS